MEIRLENYVLKAFLASTLLSMIMIALAMGLIYLFKFGSSLPISIILIVAAVSFILSASFFERYEVGSIIWSMLASVIITLLLTLISGGIIFFISLNRAGWEEMLSGLAVSMIVSMTLLNYLKRSIGEIEY